MKKGFKKILSVVLSFCLLISSLTIIGAISVSATEKITDYYVGYGGTGDGSSLEKMAPTVAKAINTINSNGLVAGDTANIWIVQDITAIERESESAPTHNLAAWGGKVNHTAKIVVKPLSSNQSKNKDIPTYLAMATNVGAIDQLIIGGPTEIDNLQLIHCANEFSFEYRYVITANGFDLTIGSNVTYSVFSYNRTTGVNWTGSTWNATDKKFSDLVVKDNVPITVIDNIGGGTPEEAKTFDKPITLTLCKDVSYASHAFDLSGFNPGHVTFKEDVNFVYNTDSYRPYVRLGTAKSGNGVVTYEKNLNVKLPVATKIGFKAGSRKVVVKGGLQLITNENVLNGFTANDYPFSNFVSNAYTDDTFTTNSKYWVLETAEANTKYIDFISGQTGRFAIDKSCKATATHSDGTTFDSIDGVLDLSAKPGDYKVTFQKEAAKIFDYYVKFGGTGDGTSVENAAPTVTAAIATMNTLNLNASDTANIWIMQNNLTDITCNSDKSHNMVYWGGYTEHSAKININAYEGNTYSGGVIENTLLSISNAINQQGSLKFGGPTVINDVQLVYTSGSNFNSESKALLNFNGKDVTIGKDAKFAYINANGNTLNDDGQKYSVAGWPSTVTKHFTPIGFFNSWVTSNTGDAVTYSNPINVNLKRGFSATAEKARLLVGASNDIFDQDVNIYLDIKENGSNARVRLGYSSYGATFNKNLNFKLISSNSFGFDPKTNITVNGAMQLILSDKATFYANNPYTNFDDKAFKKDGTAADSWILTVPADNINYIDFIEGKKGEFKIHSDFTATATNVKTGATVNSKDGILNLSETVGEYKLEFTYSKIEEETHNYDDVINYQGYNGLTKFGGALANTHKKLTTESEVNVVYMGGTVLSEAGEGSFRSEINTWFNNNFAKNTIINFIDKTFEGTGTTFGSLRVARDVVSKNPDLVFIEYSLDDYLQGLSVEKSAIQLETIVREIKYACPNSDIVVLFAATESKGSNLSLQASAHKEICDKYGISSINIGANKNIYFDVIKEFLVNTLRHGEYDDSYEIKDQVLPQISNNHLYDGDVNFVYPVDIKFTTAGGTAYNEDAKGLEIPDYFGTITSPSKSKDTLTFTFEGTELYILASEGYNAINTYKISVDGELVETKNYSGNILTKVLAGLESGKHTVVIEPSVNANTTICGFYSRDYEKGTNRLNICDLVALDENKNIDYNNNDVTGDNDVLALKKILLSNWMKPEHNSTKHIQSIARLGWRPYTGNLPEQSLLAYQKAYDTGHRILLCDIRITADGYMVCCHDDDISKVHAYTSDGVAVGKNEVKISETTLSELLTYDFGKYRNQPGLQILQIEDFLKFCKELGDATPVLEMKVDPDDEKLSELVALIKKYGFEDSVMFVSTDQRIAAALPNCTMADWVYSLTDGVIARMDALTCKSKFIYVAKDGGNEDTINFENFVKCKAKGIDIGFTYIASNHKDYFNNLKERGIFNFCKYIALDEVSWLYE